MFCSKCGKPVENDALFCPYCGTSLKQIVNKKQEESLKDEKHENKEDRKDVVEQRREKRNFSKQNINQAKDKIMGNVQRIQNHVKTPNSNINKTKIVIIVPIAIVVLLFVIVLGRFMGLNQAKTEEVMTGIYLLKNDSIYNKDGEQVQSEVRNMETLQIVWDDYLKGNYYYIDEDNVLRYVTDFGKESKVIDENVFSISNYRTDIGTLWQKESTKIRYTKNTGDSVDATAVYYSVNGGNSFSVRNSTGIVFSPNGMYSAYTKWDLGELRLYIMDLKSGEVEKVGGFDQRGYILELDNNKNIYYALADGESTDYTWYYWNNETKDSKTIGKAVYGCLDVNTGIILAIDTEGNLRYGNINNTEDFTKLDSDVEQIFLLEKGSNNLKQVISQTLLQGEEEIIYIKDNGCYYKNLNKKGEAEKALSSKEYVSDVKITNDRNRIFAKTENGLYYVDKEKNGWSEKEKITSDCVNYKITDDGKQVVFSTSELELKYWEEGKETRKLSDEVFDTTVEQTEGGVIYIDQSETLYYSPFSEKKDKVKLADDVLEFVESDNKIYYRKDDLSVYQIELNGEEKQKITDDVNMISKYQYR